MSDPLSGFAAQLRKWFQSPFQIGEMESLGDIEFNRLAGDLFRYQFELNPAYRAWCEARNVTPVQAPGWREIPLVPTAAFKEVELTCLKPAERTRCFHSSGTTGHRPSRHYHHAASLSLYEDSLAAWFVPHLLPDLEELAGNDRLGADLRLAIVSLTPPADDIPQSSLAHMIATAMERFGASDSVCVGRRTDGGDWALDSDRLLWILRRSMCANRPILLMGTAFNFVHLIELSEERNFRYQLAPESRLMETGGYKGRSRELAPAELHAELRRRLGIAPERMVTEYGMSELSSQAYGRSCGQPAPESGNLEYRFPPWVRVRVISPETGKEVGEGEVGILGVVDLANVWSVLGVQTGDLAVRQGRGFQLLGRAQQSEPRGCSLLSVESK